MQSLQWQEKSEFKEDLGVRGSGRAREREKEKEDER